MDRKWGSSQLAIVVLLMVAVSWVTAFGQLRAQEATPVPEQAEIAPASDLLDAWKQRHQEEGKTPDGAIKLWFDALFMALDPATRELGRDLLQYLTVPLRDDDQWYRRPSNQTFVSRLDDPRYHHIFRSYAEGTTPENDYAVDPASYRLQIAGSERDQYGRGWKILLVSSGADSPRPVYLRQSTTSGLWFVNSYANVYVGIRPPRPAGTEVFE
jgi:hypothetical protein